MARRPLTEIFSNQLNIIRVSRSQAAPNSQEQSKFTLPPRNELKERLLASYDRVVRRAHDYDVDLDTVIDNALDFIDDNNPNRTLSESISPTHCGCLLSDYLAHPDNTVPPYPYVAMSKLCCLQCALYFEAYRIYVDSHPEQDLVRLTTRGSHSDVIPSLPVAGMPSGKYLNRSRPSWASFGDGEGEIGCLKVRRRQTPNWTTCLTIRTIRPAKCIEKLEAQRASHWGSVRIFICLGM